jgi:hypothetical protein
MSETIDFVSTRYVKALANSDRLSPELRECVHQFGSPIVNACLQANVKKPSLIRQLVLEIWAGARQTGQAGGAEGTLDWVLAQAGASITAARLETILRDFDLRIVPSTATKEMIEASMAEVSTFDQRITKREKHQRRLMAAIKACPRRFKVARST